MKQPDEITLCTLEVVLMPNGEVICLGKTVGWFKQLKDYLQTKGGDIKMGRKEDAVIKKSSKKGGKGKKSYPKPPTANEVK